MESAREGLICRWFADIPSMRKRRGRKRRTDEQITFIAPLIQVFSFFFLKLEDESHGDA